ncbi:MAG: Holliday junction branch migration protein RuvA [Gammaproteobacteria bacterium]|nr:Holliday junction branch migration protein RuvA [Gammaproteobacteria bacterium]
MIGRLRGELIDKSFPTCLLDVSGVGYEIETSLTTFTSLPEIGSQIVLYTHFVVREDAQLLYGFLEQRERRVFRSLIKVNGVGPKLALTILSGMIAADLAACIRENDVQSLVRLPGVGKKTAERLIIDMRDRLDEWGLAEAIIEPGTMPRRSIVRSIARDAETALISLGYKPQEATRAISLIQDENLEVEDLIKEALRNMA